MILPTCPHPDIRDARSLQAQRERLRRKRLYGYAGAPQDRKRLQETTTELLKLDTGWKGK